MKELIREIRQKVGMSQEQFADALGTTVLSINRWENGKNLPTKMAQKHLASFCKEYHVPLAEMVIRSVEFPNDDDRLILYHGSKNGLIGSIAPVSRAECDFGRGFYMGTSTIQPLTLICAETSPVFYTVELDLTGLKVLSVDLDMDWAMLIAYHRKEMETAKGTALYEKYASFAAEYDIITGYIANDRMYTELASFFNGTLTDTALIHCLSALELGKQYVAVTEKACRQIRILKEKKLSMLELSALMDLSVARRKEGVALAKEIEVKYRREGRFFDEILRGDVNA